MKSRNQDRYLREIVDRKIREYESSKRPTSPVVPLSVPTFGTDEIMEAIEALTSRQVTVGARVKAFEESFSAYCGVADSVCLNSGSSANLLALICLTNSEIDEAILPGSKVLVPAVSWSTTVFPIADAGLVPVLVDVDIDTLNVSAEIFEDGLTDEVRALMPVHLLGNPVQMKNVLQLAADHDLWVVEDACEAHGALFHGMKVGSMGDVGTFSLYFSHHISTIEGGMLTSNSPEIVDLARILRSHGYSRASKHAHEFANRYPDIDSRFLFVNRGFNLRPTEIQGAFGIHQMTKLEDFIRIRRENGRYFRRALDRYSDYLLFQAEKPGTRNVYLGFSVIVSEDAPFSRRHLVDYLENAGIETRPIVAGNLAGQPAMRFVRHEVAGRLPNATRINRQGFYVGTHQGIGVAEREYVVSTFESFMRKWLSHK